MWFCCRLQWIIAQVGTWLPCLDSIAVRVVAWQHLLPLAVTGRESERLTGLNIHATGGINVKNCDRGLGTGCQGHFLGQIESKTLQTGWWLPLTESLSQTMAPQEGSIVESWPGLRSGVQHRLRGTGVLGLRQRSIPWRVPGRVTSCSCNWFKDWCLSRRKDQFCGWQWQLWLRIWC